MNDQYDRCLMPRGRSYFGSRVIQAQSPATAPRRIGSDGKRKKLGLRDNEPFRFISQLLTYSFCVYRTLHLLHLHTDCAHLYTHLCIDNVGWSVKPTSAIPIIFCRMMLSKRGLSHHAVSVCLSKRINISSKNF